MRTIQECARSFVNTLRDTNRRRCVDICDPNQWFRGVFIASQGQGNPRGSRLTTSPRIQDEMMILLKQWIKNLTSSQCIGYHTFEMITLQSFDTFASFIEQNDPQCLLMFGRIQKIHNLWLKYNIALFYSGCDNDFTTLNPQIANLLTLAHVPIDRQVIKFMNNDNSVPEYYLNVGNSSLDWKLKLQKNRYMTLQDILRSMAIRNGYDSPLHYEMDLIWHP